MNAEPTEKGSHAKRGWLMSGAACALMSLTTLIALLPGLFQTAMPAPNTNALSLPLRIFIAITATMISVAASTPLSLALARSSFSGQSLILGVLGLATAVAVFYPSMPGIAGALLSALAIGLPAAAWVTYPFARALPRDMEKAARLDGIESSILTGAMQPAMLTAAAVVLALCWRDLSG